MATGPVGGGGGRGRVKGPFSVVNAVWTVTVARESRTGLKRRVCSRRSTVYGSAAIVYFVVPGVDARLDLTYAIDTSELKTYSKARLSSSGESRGSIFRNKK